jgi:hypothetical protein
MLLHRTPETDDEPLFLHPFTPNSSPTLIEAVKAAGSGPGPDLVGINSINDSPPGMPLEGYTDHTWRGLCNSGAATSYC